MALARPIAMLVLLSAWAPPAVAQDDLQARALFERGLEAAEAGQDEQAAELFAQSQALVPRASTALNLAIVLERVDRGIAALRALDAFEEQADEAGEGDRETARALRRTIGRRLATLTLTLEPEAAEVSIDGETQAATGARRSYVLEPLEHEVRVQAPEHVAQRFRVGLSEGSTTRRSITLLPRVADVVALADEPGEGESGSDGEDWQWLAWLGGGVAVVAIVVTVALVVTLGSSRDCGSTGLCL